MFFYYKLKKNYSKKIEFLTCKYIFNTQSYSFQNSQTQRPNHTITKK